MSVCPTELGQRCPIWSGFPTFAENGSMIASLSCPRSLGDRVMRLKSVSELRNTLIYPPSATAPVTPLYVESASAILCAISFGARLRVFDSQKTPIAISPSSAFGGVEKVTGTVSPKTGNKFFTISSMSLSYLCIGSKKLCKYMLFIIRVLALGSSVL
jgi:hypothetical protein